MNNIRKTFLRPVRPVLNELYLFSNVSYVKLTMSRRQLEEISNLIAEEVITSWRGYYYVRFNEIKKRVF